jgi:hypothetical protein
MKNNIKEPGIKIAFSDFGFDFYAILLLIIK